MNISLIIFDKLLLHSSPIGSDDSILSFNLIHSILSLRINSIRFTTFCTARKDCPLKT